MSTEKFRVGAAIFDGPRLISLGWNNRRTHPAVNSIFRWHHAETACLLGVSRYDLTGTTIYVVRLGKRGNLKMSKPCSVCTPMLIAAGIKRVFYTNEVGEVERIRL